MSAAYIYRWQKHALVLKGQIVEETWNSSTYFKKFKLWFAIFTCNALRKLFFFYLKHLFVVFWSRKQMLSFKYTEATPSWLQLSRAKPPLWKLKSHKLCVFNERNDKATPTLVRLADASHTLFTGTDGIKPHLLHWDWTTQATTSLTWTERQRGHTHFS